MFAAKMKPIGTEIPIRIPRDNMRTSPACKKVVASSSTGSNSSSFPGTFLAHRSTRSSSTSTRTKSVWYTTATPTTTQNRACSLFEILSAS